MNKPFNLMVGDTIKQECVEGHKTVCRFWKVVKIFNKVFLVEDRKGIRTTFQKLDYMCGELTRIN